MWDKSKALRIWTPSLRMVSRTPPVAQPRPKYSREDELNWLTLKFHGIKSGKEDSEDFF